MTYSDRIQRSCIAPSANRYPYCGCNACLAACRLAKRARRARKSSGDYVCDCGHQFTTEHGLRSHRGRLHANEFQAVA